MMQQESWVGMQMMNNFVRNDLIQESNQRRLINRCNQENSGSHKGMISSLVSAISALLFSGSKVHRGMQSR
jgi:hypothetical protein